MKKTTSISFLTAMLLTGSAHAQGWGDTLHKPTDTTTGAVVGSAGDGAALKAYQNYDFVPGEQILFDDDFAGDQDGEFPAHWKFAATQVQAVVNQVGGRPSVVVTGGPYSRIAPRMKTASYLGDAFTIEFDFYPVPSTVDTRLFLFQGDKSLRIVYSDSKVTVAAPDVKGFVEVSGPYPESARGRAFASKWHHAAVIVRDGQLKAYLDQNRIAVQPDMAGFRLEHVEVGGWPGAGGVRFTNVRVANGGGMNLVDKLIKDGRVATHGITFDVGQATIRPESMGTIRQIEVALGKDPSLKIEIDGHTDSDGDAARNQRLSEARAESVKQVLVSDGIDAARLQTKGFGASKPVAPNDTMEGKANNRRVEFARV